MTDQPLPPPATTRSMDPLAKNFSGGTLSLFDLYRASVRAGGGVRIEDRTFTDCTIEGPALMLVLEGVFFDSTNFGPTGGVLPAFGPFTGMHALPAGEGVRRFAIAGAPVRALPG